MIESQSLVRYILLLLPIFTIVALGAYLAIIWEKLPSTVASHFDAAGRPNGWCSKGFFATLFLFGMTAMCGGIYTMVKLHQNPMQISTLYFVFMLFSWTFWLALRTNLQNAPLNMGKMLLGAIGGLLLAFLAFWSMGNDLI